LDEEYHGRIGNANSGGWQKNIRVETFEDRILYPEKSIYARPAYRNDPNSTVENFSRTGDPFETLPASRMMDNDNSLSKNYRQLVSQALEGLFDYVNPDLTRNEYARGILGDIRSAFNNLFSDLSINDLGNPLEDGTFRFTKGMSKGFAYKNLSAGEKAVFDLVLGMVVARRSYDDTLYCIDEPEIHLNTRLQANLLSALYDLIPNNCQLILATHSIGIMRRAKDIDQREPGKVVFLDFEGHDFDKQTTLEPVTPDRAFWRKVYKVSLDDLSSLIAPETIVICEGEQLADGAKDNYAHDSRCYEQIFSKKYSEVQFIPGGNDKDVILDRSKFSETFQSLFSGPIIKVISLVDRDNRSDEKIEELKKYGIRVLSRRSLESYLFDDEVLKAFLVSKGRGNRLEELLSRKQEILAQQKQESGNENLKQASGKIYNACKTVLELKDAAGHREFMRSELAPLIKPGMKVYAELEEDIFGSSRA